MSFQPGVFYFENECKEVVDIKLCTFRLWKGGNHGDGTKVTGPGTTSSLYVCVLVPLGAPYELSLERRGASAIGKGWEHAVLLDYAGDKGPVTQHPVLTTSLRGSHLLKFSSSDDTDTGLTCLRVKVCEEFCKAGARNVWKSQIRGGGLLRFRLHSPRIIGPAVSPNVPYSYQTCAVPDCPKEARRGSEWCKLHEDAGVEQGVKNPTFETLYTTLQLVDDIQKEYTPLEHGSKPPQNPYHYLTASPASMSSNPYTLSPPSDLMSPTQPPSPTEDDPFHPLWLQQQLEMQPLDSTTLSMASAPNSMMLPAAVAVAPAPAGPTDSSDFLAFFSDLIADVGDPLVLPQTASAVELEGAQTSQLAQDALHLAATTTPVLLRLNPTQAAAMGPSLRAAFGSDLLIAQLKFDRSLQGQDLHLAALGTADAWIFCMQAADFLNATFAPHGLVPPYIQPEHIHAWASNGCWELGFAVRLPSTGNHAKDGQRQQLAEQALHALTRADLQYAFPQWHVKAGEYAGMAVALQPDLPLAKRSCACPCSPTIVPAFIETAHAIGALASPDTLPHIQLRPLAGRKRSSAPVDAAAARARVTAYLTFLRSTEPEPVGRLIVQLMSHHISQSVFLSELAAQGIQVPGHFRLDLVAAMGSRVLLSEVAEPLRQRQQQLRKTLTQSLCSEEVVERCSEALDAVQRTMVGLASAASSVTAGTLAVKAQPDKEAADFLVEEVWQTSTQVVRVKPPSVDVVTQALTLPGGPRKVQLLRLTADGFRKLASKTIVTELQMAGGEAPEHTRVVWVTLAARSICPVPVVVRLHLQCEQVAYEEPKAYLPFNFAIVMPNAIAIPSIGVAVNTPCGKHERQIRLLSHPKSWSCDALCIFLQQLAWCLPECSGIVEVIPQVRQLPDVCTDIFSKIMASPCASSWGQATVSDGQTVDAMLTRSGLSPYREVLFNVVNQTLLQGVSASSAF